MEFWHLEKKKKNHNHIFIFTFLILIRFTPVTIFAQVPVTPVSAEYAAMNQVHQNIIESALLPDRKSVV